MKLSSDSLFSSESEGSEVDSSCECSLYECQDYLDEFSDAFEGNNIVRDFPECEYSEQDLAAPQTEPSVNNDDLHTQIDGGSSRSIPLSFPYRLFFETQGRKHGRILSWS